MFQDVSRLILRGVVGGYLMTHGAQKLFGVAGGSGLERTAIGFERLGLVPGHRAALAAGVSEVGGGALMALGLADPLGPSVSAATMAVAAAVGHRGHGPLAANHGYELPVTYGAAALLLAAMGPGCLSLDAALGRRLPPLATAGIVVGAAGAAAALISASRRELRRRAAAEDETRSHIVLPVTTPAP